MTAPRRELDTDERQVVGKSEVLLVDKDGAARQALRAQIESAGAIATVTDDLQHAITLAREKHFAAIVVDADTPRKGGGLDQLQPFASASPASAVVLTCAAGSFELAVQGFRRGAADVLDKQQPDQFTRRLVELCLESRRVDQRDKLLRETLDLHDQFLRRLMEAHRRAEAAEETAAGLAQSNEPCLILVVDDNPRTASGLEQALGGESEFRCLSALNGGAALDFATTQPFDIALVKEQLPDLSGSTVARTLRAQFSQSIVLLFQHPGATPGHVSIVEPTQTIELIPELKTAPQLVDRLRALQRNYTVKRREKRHLQTFRETHSDFLKKYVAVRQRIQRLLPEGREGRR